jgi:pimeloyl-ACP methyl ester carboxylesterase
MARRRGLGGLAALAIIVTALGFLPPVQARAKAVAVLAEAVGLSVPRPFAPSVARAEASFGGVTGDLYYPGQPAPAVVLIPGVVEHARGDPRVVRSARSIARAERVVFVPELELASERFVDEDIDRIVRAVRALEAHSLTTGRVAILGFSFGGSFGLLAAADPRLSGRLAQVAVFGAYFDLIGVIQAVTTGVSLVDGRRVTWEPHPLAEEILHDVVLRLVPPVARAPLGAALDGTVQPEALPPDLRAVYQLLQNRDPTRTFGLAARLPGPALETLRRFSPSSVADRITAPVIAMHSTDDPAVPYGELLRLAEALPETRVTTVSLFEHVDFEAGSPRDWVGAARDLWSAWGFAGRLLAAQE